MYFQPRKDLVKVGKFTIFPLISTVKIEMQGAEPPDVF